MQISSNSNVNQAELVNRTNAVQNKSGEQGITPNRNIEGHKEQKTIDLQNITKGEVNDLIKSGFDDLLFVLPVKSIFDESGNFNEYGSNEKFDLLGQLKGMIEFEKSRGNQTDHLEKALDKYSEINGRPFPSRIDSKA